MALRRLYYGWWVIAFLLLTVIFVYGIGIYSFTLFLKPLTEEFGWSRASVSGAVSIFWLAAPVAPVVGLLVERYGIRTMLILGVVLEGVSLILAGHVSSLWELYLLRILMGAGKVTVAIIITITASYWFSKRLGLVIGILFAGPHIGGVIWPPVTQYLMDSLGWQVTSAALGLLLLVVVVPAVAVLLRIEKPGEIGLLPDGEPIQVAQTGSQQANSDLLSGGQLAAEGFTFRETARLGTFWIIICCTVLFYFGYAGIIVHEVTLLRDAGVSTQASAYMLSLTETMAVVGVLGFGVVTDLWRPKVTAISVFFLLALAVVMCLLKNVAGGFVLYAFALLLGLAMGGGDVMWPLLLRFCFGQKHFARIYALWYVVLCATIFVSPILVGYIYDQNKSYTPAFQMILVGCVAGLLLMSFSVVSRRYSNKFN